MKKEYKEMINTLVDHIKNNLEAYEEIYEAYEYNCEEYPENAEDDEYLEQTIRDFLGTKSVEEIALLYENIIS